MAMKWNERMKILAVFLLLSTCAGSKVSVDRLDRDKTTKMLPSDVQCVGSHLSCSSDPSGAFECVPTIEPVPPQGTTCQLENVCIDVTGSRSDNNAAGTVIEIYDDSPQSRAWDGR